MKIEKISKTTLLVLVVLSLIIIVAFCFIGWENDYLGDKNVPLLTDLLLFWMYALIAGTVVATIWAAVKGMQASAGVDASVSTGVPGKKIWIVSIALLVISLAVGAVFGLGEEDFIASDGTVTTAGWVTVVDAFLTSIYILTIAAVVAVGVAMSGILTKSAVK